MADGCCGARRNRQPARSVRIAATRSLPRCKGHRYASLTIRRIVLSSGRYRYGGVPLIRYRNVCEFRDPIKRHRNIGKPWAKVRMRIQFSASPMYETKARNHFFKSLSALLRSEQRRKARMRRKVSRFVLAACRETRRRIQKYSTHTRCIIPRKAAAAIPQRTKKGPGFRRGPIDITTLHIERSERDAPAVDVTGIGV